MFVGDTTAADGEWVGDTVDSAPPDSKSGESRAAITVVTLILNIFGTGWPKPRCDPRIYEKQELIVKRKKLRQSCRATGWAQRNSHIPPVVGFHIAQSNINRVIATLNQCSSMHADHLT